MLAPPVPRPRPALALLALVALAACDGGSDPGPLTFNGVPVTARGDATLAVEGGRLVVSGLDGAREGGFAVAGAPARLDVETDPVTLPAGGRFGVVVEDAAGQTVARVSNEAVAGGVADLAVVRFAFADGVTRARVTYRIGGDVVFQIPVLDLAPGAGRAQGSAGTAEGKAGSVHVIRNSAGQYVVVSDAEAASERSGGRAGAGGCEGFVVTPPVAPPIEGFPDGTLCADWIEVEPLGGPAPAAAAVAVTARGVGTFRVRSLAREP